MFTEIEVAWLLFTLAIAMIPFAVWAGWQWGQMSLQDELNKKNRRVGA